MFTKTHHDGIQVVYRKIINGKFALMDYAFGDSYEISFYCRDKPVVIGVHKYSTRKEKMGWLVSLDLKNLFSAMIFLGQYCFRPFADIHILGRLVEVFGVTYCIFQPFYKNQLFVYEFNGALFCNGELVMAGYPFIRYSGNVYESIMAYFIGRGMLAEVKKFHRYTTGEMLLASIMYPDILAFFRNGRRMLIMEEISKELERALSN